MLWKTRAARKERGEAGYVTKGQLTLLLPCLRVRRDAGKAMAEQEFQRAERAEEWGEATGLQIVEGRKGEGQEMQHVRFRVWELGEGVKVRGGLLQRGEIDWEKKKCRAPANEIAPHEP